MLQCRKCKDFVDDERNAFCPNCGTPLAAPQSIPQEEAAASQSVQEQPAPDFRAGQQPAQTVYQYIQPGQPLPQPPQGVQQIVYICQPAPRPRNGGAITGFVFGTIALTAMLMALLIDFAYARLGAGADPELTLLIPFAIPGLVLGIVSTCKRSCTKRVFALLALIFSAVVMITALASAIAAAQVA